MNNVLFPAAYFPDPDNGYPVGLGFVYIGTINLDPTIEANRVTVYLIEENGNQVTILPAAQPLELGAGGVVLYNGSPVQVMVDGNYSMTVQDSNSVQKYYFADSAVPDYAAQIQDSGFTYLTSVAGTNTITASVTPSLTAYAVGQVFHGIAANTNAGETTLNINSRGAATVLLNGAACTGGEFTADLPFFVMCTSTTPNTFEIVSPSFNSVARTLLDQTTQSDMLQTGLGVSAVGYTLVTQATQALMRSTGLGFSADTYLGGAWTRPSFSAGNFTASGSMTWTVVSGDVVEYSYIINGKTMTVAFYIQGTLGGTVNNALGIAIPASKTAANSFRIPAWIFENGGGTTGFCQPSGTTITIQLPTGANFTAGAVEVSGCVTFEIA